MTLGLLALFVVAGVAAAVGVGALVVVLVSRNRETRNRVVPEVESNAPEAWAGAHTPEARLHRRLRDTVLAARAVPDPDGGLIRSRVEIERSAVAIDAHLVALSHLAERDRAGRLPEVEAAVASIELATAKLTDTARTGSEGAHVAVEEALARIALVDEARRELDRDPADILNDLPTPTPTPEPAPAEAEHGEEPPEQQAMPG